MSQEYEIVEHQTLQDINLFFVNLSHRNPHIHKEFELCFVIEGEVAIYSSKKSYTLSKDSLFLFNPRQPHEIYSLHNNSVILSLQISPNFCKRYYPAIQTIEFEALPISDCFTTEKNKALRKLLMQLSKCYFIKEDYYELNCYSMLTKLFVSLLNCVPWHTISETERVSKQLKSERLSHITEYIEDNFSEKILLTDIAKREELSLTYLSHFFKDTLNMSFQNYVAILRFERAKQLVEQTSMRLTDICITCGFSDYRYLNKIYQSQLGCTPKEYRKSHPIVTSKYDNTVLNQTQSFYNTADSLHMIENYINKI